MTQIWQKVLVACVLVGSVVIAFWGCHQYQQRDEEYTISINEIERAVLVDEMENKFIHVQRIGLFSGAGAGGLGAPQVSVASAAQFLELVPPGERIYTTHEVKSSSSQLQYALKKVYWAFIENRAGLLIYENVYDVQEIRPLLKEEWYHSCQISYNDETVTFQVSIKKY